MIWFVDIKGDEKFFNEDENLTYSEDKVIGSDKIKYSVESDRIYFELSKEVYEELKEAYPR